MIDYIRKYPALTMSLVSAVVNLLLHFLPGLPDGPLMDVLSAVMSLVVGVQIHRQVSPVPVELRGLRAPSAPVEPQD